MKKYIWALFLMSSLYAGSVFKDGVKNFMWQDITANRELLFTWDEAKEYCDDLRFYGFEDWSLPSEEQMVTIVDSDRKRGKRIRREFRYFAPAGYWTSTTYAFNAPHAWYINFYDGHSRSAEKEKRFYVRCIRMVSED